MGGSTPPTSSIRSSPSSPTSRSTTRTTSATPSPRSPAKKPASCAPTAPSSPFPSTPRPTRPSAKPPPRLEPPRHQRRPLHPPRTHGTAARAHDTAHARPCLARNHYTLTLASEPLDVDSPLSGQHQQRNIALAIAAADELRNPTKSQTNSISNQNSYKITNANIEAGIRNTRWPGRLELLHRHSPSCSTWPTIPPAPGPSAPPSPSYPKTSPAPSSSPASATKTSAR